MSRARVEPVHIVKARRDTALAALAQSIPHAQFLGIGFERKGDEMTATLTYHRDLIGNPGLPALHGGVTASFLEITALIGLSWSILWPGLEDGSIDPDHLAAGNLPKLPKTIGMTIDYLRSGLPRDAYARARVNRMGRRYASVQIDAWQDNRERLYAQGTGHFLMPDGE